MTVQDKHPDMTADRLAEWALCHDAANGESAIKSRGTTYLPSPSGYSAAAGMTEVGAISAYNAYKMRAQFPDVLAASIGSMIGIIHGKDSEVQLPAALEYLLENVDGKKSTLETFHKGITRSLLTKGRYGVLADAPLDGGDPFLAGYEAETIINWDEGFFVLDETGYQRDGYKWSLVERHRVLQIIDGSYAQIVHGKLGPIDVTPTRQGGGLLDRVPFEVANARNVSCDIETPPLIGVARAALAMYQLSADYRLQLYMSGQETLVAINGEKPTAVGAGVVHEMIGASDESAPDLKYVGPSCIGIDKHLEAIEHNRDAAVQSGARLFEQSQQAQESGEARKMRFRSETANLQTVAQASSALLERSLRNIAAMKGQNEDECVVTAPDDLLDATLSPADAAALWQVVQSKGLSYETFYEQMQKGGIASMERDADEEYALIENREFGDDLYDIDQGANGLTT